MSIIDANIKTSKCEKQFFQTLPEQVDALLLWLKYNNFEAPLKILDAGSGKGRIANKFKTAGYNVTTIDKHFEADIKGDFLKHNFKDRFNIVVSNPPYISRDKTKYQFIDKALEIADTVIFFFPLQMLNYIYFCENYLDKENYIGRLTLYPKVILNPEGKLKQGGNTGYGWFIFGRIKNSSIPFEQFIDTRRFRK